jgi:flagellar biosynthesis protein FlhA
MPPEGRSLLKGYTVVDAATVLSTHLTELLKNNMSDLLSYGEVQKLLKELPKEQGELLKDIVPSLITISGIQRVLQLLAGRARLDPRPIHHSRGHCRRLPFSRNPVTLAEHVRARLARQICAQYTGSAGYLPLIALSAKWEQAFAESMIGQGDDRNWPCSLRNCRNSSRWCASVSKRRRAKARRRCWSRPPA